MRKKFLSRILSGLLSGVMLFTGIATSGLNAYADGDQYKLLLRVPENTDYPGNFDYYNGSEYGVYLKYKVDESGNLIDPKAGTPVVAPKEAGVVDPDFFTTAKKVGTAVLTSGRYILQIDQENGKNVKGIYVIRQEKRAPGFLPDTRTDGKYAEVEFPVMRDGVPLPLDSQQIEITLKPKEIKKSDFLLFKKKNASDEPIQGIRFDLFKTHSPERIAPDQSVAQWRDLGHPVQIPTVIESAADGSVRIPAGTILKEGKYYLEEKNQNEKGFGDIGKIHFTIEYKNGEVVLNYDAIRDSNYIVGTDGKADGSDVTLYNYRDVKPIKNIVLPDGTRTKKTSINANTPFLFEIKVPFPADYENYYEMVIEDTGIVGEGVSGIRFMADPVGQNSPEIVGPDVLKPDGNGLFYIGEVGAPRPEDRGEYTPAELYYEFNSQKTALKEVSGIIGDIYNFSLAPMGGSKYDTQSVPSYMDRSGSIFKLSLSKEQILSLGRKMSGKQNQAPGKLNELGDIVIRFYGYGVDTNSSTVYENTAKVKYRKNNDIKRPFIHPGPETVPYSEKLSIPTQTKFTFVNIDLKKIDKETGGALRDAEFYLFPKGMTNSDSNRLFPIDLDQNDRSRHVFSSSSSGSIDGLYMLPFYPQGYELVEKKAPDGYRLPSKSFVLEFKDGTITDGTSPLSVSVLSTHSKAEKFSDFEWLYLQDASGANGKKLLIENIKKSTNIVDTGTSDALGFVALSVGLAGAWYFIKKKKEA